MSNTHMTLDEFYHLHNKLESSEVILDVRTVEEFTAGHIENALNIPLDQISGKINDLKKFKTIYIHCKRGGRARTAFEALSQMGLKNLVCIHDAGMDMWIEKGYPVKI
jgi:rhodanese-related sulfurtransferase